MKGGKLKVEPGDRLEAGDCPAKSIEKDVSKPRVSLGRWDSRSIFHVRTGVTYSKMIIYLLEMTNIAIENGPCIVDLPILKMVGFL